MNCDRLQPNENVAPFVGAWIEIIKSYELEQRRIVAPFVGAWIEIASSFGTRLGTLVAPFVGAWIEISVVLTEYVNYSKSLPLWERGLKYLHHHHGVKYIWSLPLWERGLKSQCLLGL